MNLPAHITSTTNPRIKAVVRLLREHRERRRTGLFVAEGRRQIQRALAAGLSLHELYECPTFASDASSSTTFDLPANQQAQVVQVSEAVMRKMAYKENPESLLAVFAQPKWSLQSSVELLQSVADSNATSSDPPLYLIAMGISKPGNLGAMARTASAAGCRGLLVADAVVDAFNPNVIHASTGAVFTLPILAGSTADILAFLAAQKIKLIAAVVQADRAYTQVDLTGPTALVIGAEDKGLDDTWQQAAKLHGHCVTIPMAVSPVDSLNASNAAAILLFEALRQRRMASHP